jgi:hypothetical protein
MKTSAVLISAGSRRGFYTSVQEVPEPLRTQLLEVTAGENSGTIVIADRAGQDHVTQMAARRESARGAALRARTFRPAAAPAPPRRRSFAGLSWVVWAGIALLFGSAGIITALFAMR